MVIGTILHPISVEKQTLGRAAEGNNICSLLFAYCRKMDPLDRANIFYTTLKEIDADGKYEGVKIHDHFELSDKTGRLEIDR